MWKLSGFCHHKQAVRHLTSPRTRPVESRLLMLKHLTPSFLHLRRDQLVFDMGCDGDGRLMLAWISSSASVRPICLTFMCLIGSSLVVAIVTTVPPEVHLSHACLHVHTPVCLHPPVSTRLSPPVCLHLSVSTRLSPPVCLYNISTDYRHKFIDEL